MRIAFLTPLWPPSMAQNGIVTYVDVMTRALERRGHECVIITMWPHRKLEDSRVLPLVPPRLNGAEKLLRRVRGRIEGAQAYDYTTFGRGIANALIAANNEKPVDVIEAEESFGLARYCVGATGAPVIVRSHGPHFLVHQGSFMRGDRRRVRKEGAAFREADGVSFPSRALRDAVGSHYGVSFASSGEYPNPIDIPPDVQGWTLDGCDPNTIVFIGRFDAVKGSDIALKAFERVVEKRPEAKLVMAGVDHGLRGADGELRKFDDYVRAYVPEHVRERIEFLGPVPRDDVPKLRRRGLVSFTASRFETFSYVVAEAMAMGAPVVSTATPSLAEYLKDEEEILFSPVGDADALAARLEHCLADPAFASGIGAAGRKAAIRLFSADAIAAQAEAYYSRFLGRAQQSGAVSL